VNVVSLGLEAEHEIVDVLVDAFAGYPVMRYVLGTGGGYDDRLRRLVGFFVGRRLRQGGPGLGVREGGAVVAAAVLTRPVEPEMPAAVARMRDELWRNLGEAARQRYDAYVAAARTFDIGRPHHHLNMIGVGTSHQGRGLARPLLEAVRQMSADDPASAGVSLTTELSRNVTLYQRFGYAVTGHVRVAPELETWGMFRAG
jgi:GNAT superfamily N-acetyltransferase